MTQVQCEVDRLEVLRSLGATASDAEVLLDYNQNLFQQPDAELLVPLAEEACVADWRDYANHVRAAGSLNALQAFLPQLCFPIQAGMSSQTTYLEAVQHGQIEDLNHDGVGVGLIAPERGSLEIYSSYAGPIAVITASERRDFESLVRALGRKNEPSPVPGSMGALMIGGYRNWHRWHRIHAQHSAEEAALIVQDKSRWQDRFMILSSDYYSGVQPEQISIPPAAWRGKSWIIRREHEVAHYFCRRVLGSMRNNLLDEILADYCGIVQAFGTFKAAWLLLFLGLESFPEYRKGARMENYRSDGHIGDSAFVVLQRLVYRAAHTLEEFHQSILARDADPTQWPAALLAISSLHLEELASTHALPLLQAAYVRSNAILRFTNTLEEVSL